MHDHELPTPSLAAVVRMTSCNLPSDGRGGARRGTELRNSPRGGAGLRAEGTASRPRAPQAMPSVTSTERLCRLSSHLQPRSQLCGAVGAAGEVQPRARDLGVPFAGEPGSTNSIVDVPAPVFRVNCIMLAPSRLLDVIGFLVPAGGGGRCWALHDHTRRE